MKNTFLQIKKWIHHDIVFAFCVFMANNLCNITATNLLTTVLLAKYVAGF